MGILGKVLKTLLLSTPLEYGTNAFGSNVSVCAIPPAIQSNITVSALEVIAGADLQEFKKLAMGILVEAADKLAAAIFFIKSLRALICRSFSIVT